MIANERVENFRLKKRSDYYNFNQRTVGDFFPDVRTQGLKAAGFTFEVKKQKDRIVTITWTREIKPKELTAPFVTGSANADRKSHHRQTIVQKGPATTSPATEHKH